MRKTTEINFKTKSGRDVRVVIDRVQGMEKEKVWVDQYLETNIYKDDYTIKVAMDNDNFHECELSKMQGYDVLRYVEGRKAYNIALSDGIYNKIKAAITENFMVSPEVEKEIEEVKTAIKAGHVLPLAELTAKRKKYKRDMLEGGYGYNPFDNYISSEKVERMKSKYPDRF